MRSIRTVTTFYSMTLQRNNKNDMNNDTQKVIDAIMTRTSVRQYTDEPITDQEIETLLKAGMAAPSACNLQPWRFVVVTNAAVKKAISEQIKPAGPASKAPVVIVVCGDMDHTFEAAPDYWAEDCSAATENIMLAAHAMGLGTVWMGIYPQKERYELLKDLLNLPNNIKAFGMIAVGHPAEHPAPKDKWDANKVHYEKW